MKDVSAGSSEEKGKGFFGQLVERCKEGKASARLDSLRLGFTLYIYSVLIIYLSALTINSAR